MHAQVRRLGMSVADDDAQALMVLWQYSGHLNGVIPELAAESEQEALRFKAAILDIRPRQELVDLGCGNGQLLAEIAGRFPNIRLCGIDSAAGQLELNRQTVPSCRFVEMDLSSA